MQFRYSISRADLLEAQRRHAGLWSVIGALFGVLMIAAGVIGVFSNTGAVYTAIAPILFGLLFVFRLQISASLQFRRDFAKNPEITATISESGIQFASTKGVGEIFWPAFVRFEETTNLFILYVQSNLFHLIPKRAVAADAMPELQATLRTRMAGRPAKRGKNIRMIIFWTVVAIMAAMLIIVIRKRAA